MNYQKIENSQINNSMKASEQMNYQKIENSQINNSMIPAVMVDESKAMKFARQPKAVRDAVLAQLPDDVKMALPYDWDFWARPKQKTPKGNWTIWICLAGRGWGKSRVGAEQCRKWAKEFPGCRIALIGPTAADVRDVMVEGESGIINVCPESERPLYEPSKRRVTWPNGSQAFMYSADEPDRLRGPQHHFAWCDELATWRYPETWDMMLFGLRLGMKTRIVITTTPKPAKLLRDILNSDDLMSGNTVKTVGTTFENRDNLAPSFFESIVNKYQNSNLGKQELYAVLLDDLQGALWSPSWFKQIPRNEIPEFRRVVVAIDPAVTSKKSSDQTGICVAALGVDNNYYVLHLQGYRLSPQGWAEEAVRLYKKYGATKIVVETNNGGEMVEATLRHVTKYKDETGKTKPINGKDLPIKKITASKGKRTRAEPIAALYQQGRVWHTQFFEAGEKQMSYFMGDPNEEDDLVDSNVYCLTELSEGEFTEYVAPRVGGRRTSLDRLQSL